MNAFTSKTAIRGAHVAAWLKTRVFFARLTLALKLNYRAARFGVVLTALLQRGPAERIATVTEEVAHLAPIGVWLRSALAVTGSLGAIHSLAGATVLVATASSPVSTTVGNNVQIGFTVTNTINIASWKVTGNIPPGLMLSAEEGGTPLSGPGMLDATTPGMPADPYGGYGGGGSDGNMTTTPLLTGKPTQAGTYTFNLQAYEFPGLSGLASNTFSFTINVAASTGGSSAPSFNSQPAGRSVSIGNSVTLTVDVSGTPAPTLQWMKNGTAIPGATGTTLTLNSVQASDAGDYTVVANNSAGSTTSSKATLTVSGGGVPTLPVISRQPAAQTIATGTTAVFSADVTASPAPTYQWRKNGALISGATNASLVIQSASGADTGNYSVDITNSVGKVTSSSANLVVSNVAPTDVGRLINLSILTFSGTGDDALFVGFAVGGSGTSGTKPLLIRAIGPSLAPFGVGNLLADPSATIVRDGTTVATNDNWSGDATIKSRISQTGAFPIDDASLDAALALTPTNGTYSIKIGGKNNGTGNVIAEIYDATGGSNMTATTPRLINVSARAKIASSTDVLAAGFVISGATARTVLIRATGPALAAFGLGGTLDDPKLQLYADSTLIRENDNWGGDPQLISLGSSVGAFGVADPASKDAMILITLPPGLYSARVSGVNGSTGVTLVEVYEIP